MQYDDAFLHIFKRWVAVERAFHNDGAGDALHDLALAGLVRMRVVPVDAGLLVLRDLDAVGVLMSHRDDGEHTVAVIVGRNLHPVEVDVGVVFAIIDDIQFQRVARTEAERWSGIATVEAGSIECLVAGLHFLLTNVHRRFAYAVLAAHFCWRLQQRSGILWVRAKPRKTEHLLVLGGDRGVVRIGLCSLRGFCRRCFIVELRPSRAREGGCQSQGNSCKSSEVFHSDARSWW